LINNIEMGATGWDFVRPDKKRAMSTADHAYAKNYFQYIKMSSILKHVLLRSKIY